MLCNLFHSIDAIYAIYAIYAILMLFAGASIMMSSGIDSTLAHCCDCVLGVAMQLVKACLVLPSVRCGGDTEVSSWEVYSKCFGSHVALLIAGPTLLSRVRGCCCFGWQDVTSSSSSSAAFPSLSFCFLWTVVWCTTPVCEDSRHCCAVLHRSR